VSSTYAPPTTETETEPETEGDPVSAGGSRASFGMRFGFKAKLVVMVAVPLAALVLLLGFDIADRFSRQRDLQDIVVASALISDAERVIDELRLERSRSSLYLSSVGSLYRSELIGQWEETDAALATFNGALARYEDDQEGRSLVLQYSDLREDLEQVDGMRRRALESDATWSESLAFYSSLVKQFRNSTDGMRQFVRLDSELTTLFMGFLHVSDAVEAAGVERAVVSRVLTEGTIEHDELDLLGRLAGRQEDALQSYNHHVPSGLRSPYPTDLASAELDRVAAARGQLATGDFSLDPGEWFDIASVPIDTLHTTKDGLLVALEKRSKELADEAHTEMWRFSAFGVLILAASLLVAALVGRRLSKRTIKLARVARAIKEGDTSQRADTSVGDELGTLAVAFNQMTDDLTTVNRRLETQVEGRTTQLRTSEAHNRAMLEAIPDLIFRLNSDGFYIDYQAPNTPESFPRRSGSSANASLRPYPTSLQTSSCRPLAGRTNPLTCNLLSTSFPWARNSGSGKPASSPFPDRTRRWWSSVISPSARLPNTVSWN